MWRDIETVLRAIETILAGDDRLKADKFVIRDRHRLGPDLHGGERIVTVDRLLGNGQDAMLRNTHGDTMREGIRHVGRLRIPLIGMWIEAWRPGGLQFGLVALSHGKIRM